MVAFATTDLFWNHAKLVADPYGTFPVTELGYTVADKGVMIKVGNKQAFDEVAELDGVAIAKTQSRDASITLALKQFTAANWAIACGIPYVSPELEPGIGGGTNESPELAVCAIGTRRDGSPIHVYLPRCIVQEDVQIDWKKKTPAEIPLAFMAMDGSHKMIIPYFGRTVQSATIATGAFARTQLTAAPNGVAWVKLSGESAAADILDDITGSSPSLTNLERIRLQITTTAQPITINHATGVIELKDAVDWVMTHLADWIDLYYETSTTTWKEICRYDAFA